MIYLLNLAVSFKNDFLSVRLWNLIHVRRKAIFMITLHAIRAIAKSYFELDILQDSEPLH